MSGTSFTIMAKPVGSLCNMACSYCYYLHADNNSCRALMDDETLETFIRNYIEASPDDAVSFTWHGGEPALAGMAFYRKAIRLQKQYTPQGRTIWNNLQTNGQLLDDAWCRFLKDNHFDVGISIDGTRFVHDTYRKDTAGNGTYDRVRETVLRLKKYGIKADLLCTVTAETAASALAVYKALRFLDTGWMQFIPIVRRIDGKVTEDSVTPEAYGRFLKTVFREWSRNDLGKVNVQLFAETALGLAGKGPNVCFLAETCGNVPVVESDGSVYSYDHFVDQPHRLGHVKDLALLVHSEEQTAFGQRKKTTLSGKCRECPYLSLCGGGCPKDRFLPENDEEIYYLCEGMRMYFDAAVPVLTKAMELSRKQYTPAQIMKQL